MDNALQKIEQCFFWFILAIMMVNEVEKLRTSSSRQVFCAFPVSYMFPVSMDRLYPQTAKNSKDIIHTDYTQAP